MPAWGYSLGDLWEIEDPDITVGLGHLEQSIAWVGACVCVVPNITVGWISEALTGPGSQLQRKGNHKTTRWGGEGTLCVVGRRERETEGMKA